MGTLQTCNSDGMSVTALACALGCGSDATTCATFVPSNNLAGALAAAASASVVDIPDGASIDTDTGTITGVAVTSMVVAVQNISIRVFAAPSWTLPDLRITGANPVAFVATGAIDLEGFIDLSSRAPSDDGAGANTTAACQGGDPPFAGGGGGGGGATMGGSGAGSDSNAGGVGGAVASGFAPLVGGCAGGARAQDMGDGGGAIQLVSLTSVTIEGAIDVSGAGGGASAGGGAGGNVVIESPTVELKSGAFMVANGGGGGGGCGVVGANGGSGSTTVAGGVCSDGSTGGYGGTETTAPTSGVTGSDDEGGGGGSLGRAHIVTANGAFQQDSGALTSIAITPDTLVHD